MEILPFMMNVLCNSEIICLRAEIIVALDALLTVISRDTFNITLFIVGCFRLCKYRTIQVSSISVRDAVFVQTHHIVRISLHSQTSTPFLTSYHKTAESAACFFKSIWPVTLHLDGPRFITLVDLGRNSDYELYNRRFGVGFPARARCWFSKCVSRLSYLFNLPLNGYVVFCSRSKAA
jgi:hypothetical protein